ncbi:hypothetical protein PCAR4_60081 [Paraburkholderia caribensis]|nr:hypothetical protein PCAR4_60081 [Paraburkholderia caribensis]
MSVYAVCTPATSLKTRNDSSSVSTSGTSSSAPNSSSAGADSSHGAAPARVSSSVAMGALPGQHAQVVVGEGEADFVAFIGRRRAVIRLRDTQHAEFGVDFEQPLIADEHAVRDASMHARIAIRKAHFLGADIDMHGAFDLAAFVRHVQRRARDVHDRAAWIAAPHFARQRIRAAEKRRRERRSGALVCIERRAQLRDAPFVQHGDAIAHRHRFDLIVRDEDRRDAEALLDRAQFDMHFFAQLRVEIRHRLVEQQQFGAHRQRPRNRDALALAARQFLRIARVESLQTHQIERFGDAHRALVALHVAHLQAEADVARHRHVRKQRVALEHDAHAALFGSLVRDVAAAEHDAARARRDEAGDHLQRGRLAAAGRTEQRQKLAAFDGQIEMLDGGEVAVALRKALQGEEGHKRRSCADAGVAAVLRLPCLSLDRAVPALRPFGAMLVDRGPVHRGQLADLVRPVRHARGHVGRQLDGLVDGAEADALRLHRLHFGAQQILDEVLRELGLRVLRYRARRNLQRDAAFLRIDELEREAGVLQRDRAAAAVGRDDDVARLHQAVHFAGRRRPRQHVGRDLLRHRGEAGVDVLFAAAVHAREHHERMQAIRVRDGRHAELALQAFVGQHLPRVGRGQAELLERLFVVADARRHHADTHGRRAEPRERIEVLHDGRLVDLGAQAQLHRLIHRAVVHHRDVDLLMPFLRLELGERVARIARDVDDFHVMRFLERRDDLLTIKLLVGATDVRDVQRRLGVRGMEGRSQTGGEEGGGENTDRKTATAAQRFLHDDDLHSMWEGTLWRRVNGSQSGLQWSYRPIRIK